MTEQAQSKHVVLGVTGSIAAYKAVEIVRSLRKKNFRVSVITTKAAEKFVTPLTLATVSNEKVWRFMFDGEADGGLSAHIRLAQEADVLAITPASADSIGKIANGLAGDLLSAVAMATKAPMIIAPAMNDAMYCNPIVQENCRKLKDLGVVFVDPEEGELACGTCGPGRLAAIEDIVAMIEKVTSDQ